MGVQQRIVPPASLGKNSGDEDRQSTIGEAVDINGDGRVDWVVSYKDPTGATTSQTWINDVTGWRQESDLTAPIVLFDYAALADGKENANFYDINADGLPDIVQAETGAQTLRNTWLNTGKG